VRLVELCLSLPDDQKMRNGVTRSIQRRALAGIVPDVVLRRPDKGRINDAVLVGLLRAERGRLDGGDLGRAGAFLEASPGSLSGSSDPSDLAARWQSTALARWLDMAFPPVGVTL
jgi:asparagine synthase (glutamine-hydrolysing)